MYTRAKLLLNIKNDINIGGKFVERVQKKTTRAVQVGFAGQSTKQDLLQKFIAF